MNIMERSLVVKFELWQKFGVKRGVITEKILREAIYRTGLSKKSRVLKTVISYLRDYRHLGYDGKYYYIIYKKKDKAKPKDVIPSPRRNSEYDIQHNIPTNQCMPGALYPRLMNSLISDFPMISRGLEEKGFCVIKIVAMKQGRLLCQK